MYLATASPSIFFFHQKSFFLNNYCGLLSVITSLKYPLPYPVTDYVTIAGYTLKSSLPRKIMTGNKPSGTWKRSSCSYSTWPPTDSGWEVFLLSWVTLITHSLLVNQTISRIHSSHKTHTQSFRYTHYHNYTKQSKHTLSQKTRCLCIFRQIKL